MFSLGDIDRSGWTDRGAMGVSYNSVVAADFDSQLEMAWVVDKFATVTSLTPGSAANAAEHAVHWNVYSTFRALRDPASTPCTAAVAGFGNLFLMSTDRIKAHRWGGMCALNIELPNLAKENGLSSNSNAASSSLSAGAAAAAAAVGKDGMVGGGGGDRILGGNKNSAGSNASPPSHRPQHHGGFNTLQLLQDKGTAVFGSDLSATLNLLHIETAMNEASVVQVACGTSPITSLRVVPAAHQGASATSSMVITGTLSGEVSLRDPRDMEHMSKSMQSFLVAPSFSTSSSSMGPFAHSSGAGASYGAASSSSSSAGNINNRIAAVDLRGYTLVASAVERRYCSVVKFFDIRKATDSSTAALASSAALLGTLNFGSLVNWARLYPSDVFADSSLVVNADRCALSSAMEVQFVDASKLLSDAMGGAGGYYGNSNNNMFTSTPVSSSPASSPAMAAGGFGGNLSEASSPISLAAGGGALGAAASPQSSSGAVIVSMRLLTADGSPVPNAHNRQLCTAAAISPSGRAMLFASDRGVMQTLSMDRSPSLLVAANEGEGQQQQQARRVLCVHTKVAAAAAAAAGKSYDVADENTNNNSNNNINNKSALISSLLPKSALAMRLAERSSSEKYPPQPVAISKWREFGLDSGFVQPKRAGNTSPSAPERLLSDWPPDHYVFLAVDAPATQLPAHLAEHAGSKLLNSEAAGVRRCDAYASNPKDKLGRVIPNPYPFNSELGTDKAVMLSLLIEKRAKQKKAARAAAPRSFYSKMEESLQLCYSAGGHSHGQGSSAQASFDWSHYNMSKTIVGLDNSLPEAFVFAGVLHALYHVQGDDPNGIRKALMNHICAKPACVACELGFLFSNMATQGAHYMGAMPITQPTNFFRTLRQIPPFRAFFAERAKNRDESIARTHRFVKMLLQAVDDDLRTNATKFPITGGRHNCAGGGGAATPNAPENLQNFMASTFGTELALQSGTPLAPHFLWELPASASEVIEGLQHLLRELERMHVGEPVVIQTLPTVLVLLLNPDHGTMRPPPNLNFARQSENYAYHHCGSIVHLARDHDDPGHSVNHIKVGHGPQHEHWYLINDYAVSKAMQREDNLESMIPRHLPHAPTVAFYVRQPQQPQPPGKRFGHHTHERPNLFDAIGRGLVYDFGSAQLGRNPAAPCEPPAAVPGSEHQQKQQQQDEDNAAAAAAHAAASGEPASQGAKPSADVDPLQDENEIQPGDLVAIDAEYVRLAWGNELRNADGEVMTADELPDDWTRRMLQQQRKPMMSLARVSCILSQRDGHERVIVDDYIETTSETVEDYVTLYSGIAPGDLDPKTSRRRLTTAKAAHLRLRALLDRGARFIGHGLGQDFRVINLAIPPTQLVDTVEIFAKPGHRKISLRWLAFHALKERVQESMHDSIEDARTALRLYRLYEQLQREGRWEEELERLFELGADTHWRIEEAGAASGSPGSPGSKGDDGSESCRTTPPSLPGGGTPLQDHLTPGRPGTTASGIRKSGSGAEITGGDTDPLLRGSSPMKPSRTGSGGSAGVKRRVDDEIHRMRDSDDNNGDTDDEEEEDFDDEEDYLFDEEEEEEDSNNNNDVDDDEDTSTSELDTREPSPMSRSRGGTGMQDDLVEDDAVGQENAKQQQQQQQQQPQGNSSSDQQSNQ